VPADAADPRPSLITAHPDVAVQTPDREHDVVLPEGAIPAHGVLVIRVDQRPIHIEDHRADTHVFDWSPGRHL
jgi:hypothetical protein